MHVIPNLENPLTECTGALST